MTLYLDHTFVPAKDHRKAAKFIARILDVSYAGVWAGFAVVKVNETLSLDFVNDDDFKMHHFAFLASDEELDAVVERLKKEGRPFGSGGGSMEDGKINHLHGGRGVYFKCDDGHIWEVLTHTYVLSSFKKGPQD